MAVEVTLLRCWVGLVLMKCNLFSKESFSPGSCLFVWNRRWPSSLCSSVKGGNWQPIIYSAMFRGWDWLLHLISSRAWKLELQVGVFWLCTVQWDRKTLSHAATLSQFSHAVLDTALALFTLSQQMFLICCIIIAHTERALMLHTLCIWIFLNLCVWGCFELIIKEKILLFLKSMIHFYFKG